MSGQLNTDQMYENSIISNTNKHFYDLLSADSSATHVTAGNFVHK